uniref:Protein Flattop n=1 Tax=Maylandia zebra TaxID=106582 RepID=A0A3P9C7P0_9CICH
MSSSYSANQYDSAFKPHRLQNWCETKHFKERPSAQVGRTTFIADDRGHLLPGVGKRGLAWPDFKGTWDLPARIPGQRINPTARSVEGLNRLKSWGRYPKNPDRAKLRRRPDQARMQILMKPDQAKTGPDQAELQRPDQAKTGPDQAELQRPDQAKTGPGEAGAAETGAGAGTFGTAGADCGGTGHAVGLGCNGWGCAGQTVSSKCVSTA